ncbi:MAG: anaerobic ribonucleoside-triphosphate reductase activating protein [Candidatus Portnoybacteria bacterium RIFCSPLOWO2_12_FULL_39_9]|uniref:Anaerobic ribonucleoside-triphosphate reductase activating protein n=1 Tax=Candidatus Portnoybacteria bacterium RIFCSPHIGHO2_12_FULL_38_9 TaxID=1801997 RepID=A0A1G2FI81_9BACT|nr:MAG: anaerobic ribonucleoside-triphosphate reductase activating protein [Candidatus Portnoybacteria bacterium RBG_13_40_8]OGZ36097.1 MAG: anaerobic ribonucleoside-triphosphate reductase activating protein [Candidatus Portnoybacteria bacterium RIFCSPHIGHO2_02_FULL_39_12]OGZ37547.1 MAG: anaerobic ribonucleoside-triphosphate reductase activating protein [Candidatus Portnoybacteria bacterium RIFCSPHIGHO2_12_FULL_38_9]OGZ39425.1 MAG: anaerobic ribonucleoside-triphosphate reductase activating prote
MKIGGLEKLSLIDYPGKIAATVFVAGCGFRCGWCHNSELVLPEKIRNQPEIEEKDLFDFLDFRKGLLEGVCLTGGEPSLYSDLPVFIKKIKQKGFLVKLDTNGSNPKMLKKLLEERLLDFVAMDIKSSPEKYPQAIGMWEAKLPTSKCGKLSFPHLSDNIQKSVDLIRQSKIDYEFRSTIIPGLIDKKEIKKIGQWIRGAKCFALQQFRPEKTLDKAFQKIRPYSENKLKALVKIINPYVEKTVLRGI